MTLVISWIKYEPPSTEPNVWTVSDGKIMGPDRTLTLEGSKVLELPIRIKHMQGLPPRQIYFRSSVGFAYAGSSLIGLNTFATLNDVFNNLGGDKSKNHLPTYSDIIQKAKVILRHYASTIFSPCEISLFGFCPKTKLPFTSKIKTKTLLADSDFDEEIIYGNVQQLQYILLGDKKEEVTKTINDVAKEYNATQYQYWKIPEVIFYDIVKSNTYETIGGGMQLAIAYGNEFQMTALVVPMKDDKTKATLSHKNFDIFDDIGINVGECVWAIDAMDIGATQNEDD